MHGVKGRITRATGGEHRTVYLSDAMGVWEEGDHLHVTLHKGDQMLHTKLSPVDGQLYDALRLLCQQGVAQNP